MRNLASEQINDLSYNVHKGKARLAYKMIYYICGKSAKKLFVDEEIILKSFKYEPEFNFDEISIIENISYDIDSLKEKMYELIGKCFDLFTDIIKIAKYQRNNIKKAKEIYQKYYYIEQ